jgi:hypothetical protein
LRQEIIKAGSTADKKMICRIFPYGAVAEFITLQTVCLLVIGNGCFIRLHFGETFISGYPDVTGVVFFNGVNGIIRQAIFCSELLENGFFFCSVCLVDPVQAITGTYPDPVVAVVVKGKHIIIGKAAFIGEGLEGFKTPGPFIQQTQAAVTAGNP